MIGRGESKIHELYILSMVEGLLSKLATVQYMITPTVATICHTMSLEPGRLVQL